MSRFRLVLHVEPRPGVLDPQGAATRRALEQLGFASVQAVRVGKEITLEVEAPDASEARRQVEEMVRVLLVNPSTESYRMELAETPGRNGSGAAANTTLGAGAR
ncbi:phosphoribosylformylglycinamidine synthase subunit PurS [Limnochorda pilosa]|uniref:Phosphoribosylformylglycinamidine synthase subunit PurS n=1 Tax=Limnochorda pilosa TaxID=1555112 RepID=A0A0K2SKN1_LIMPI|nr:phosphoribosylformylglycinamidine synthase subunit PurS [Limnochorda pilosa]BAS27419.1 phosphoribosylformylglycinamidine synthase [Limnochorda pilosa]